MLPIVSMPSWTLPDVEGEREGDGTGGRGDKGKDGGETKVQMEEWTGREERGTERGVERLKKTMYSITNQNYLVTLTVTHKSDDCVLTPLHYSLVLFQHLPGPCQVQLVLE